LEQAAKNVFAVGPIFRSGVWRGTAKWNWSAQCAALFALAPS